MLVIISTHPIQYQVPIWKALAKRLNVEFEVWYLTSHGVEPTFDIQFGKTIKWDIDLLDGYTYRFSRAHCPKQLTGFWSAKLPNDFKSKLKSKEVTHILILGWNVRAFIEVALISWKCGIELWLRAESNDLTINSYFKQKIKNLFLKLYFNNIDKFLTIGKANRRLYESFGVGEDRLYNAPYCIENKRFAEQANQNIRKRDKLRKSWNIDAKSFCVLFVGKFMHKKRPEDIINAIKILQKKGIRRRYHVLYVGTGELGADLREKSNVVFDSEEQINSHYGNHDLPMASFTGFVNQSKISEAYIAADLLVLPSDADETWGLVTNEAMASGLPCVVSDACGSSEDLAAAVDPILRFPLGNIECLANAIQYVAESPPSKTLIKKVIDRYDFIYTVDTLEKLYKENKVN